MTSWDLLDQPRLRNPARIKYDKVRQTVPSSYCRKESLTLIQQLEPYSCFAMGNERLDKSLKNCKQSMSKRI